jgi:sugar transferase (PEP-CTERM/EpsH1 system associated)
MTFSFPKMELAGPGPNHVLPPLIAHLVYRFDVGGLESGILKLIEYIPAEKYRQAIVCMADYTDFRHQISRRDIPIFAIHKRPGKDLLAYERLWRLLHDLKPAILHTRNLGTLEGQVCGFLAGVPARVHGEHGRDVYDLYGDNRKYNVLRKALRPVIHHYTAVSKDLAGWLAVKNGIRACQITQISNGVDCDRFHPLASRDSCSALYGFASENSFVIGTVGRMQAVKDQLTLVRAFLELRRRKVTGHDRLRLVVIGEGPLRESCLQLLRDAGAEQAAWLPGERRDVAECLQSFDLFVLPSLGEGMSNTILEAMASGLPVIATRVGGNPELVDEGQTGFLVPPASPAALATAIQWYIDNPSLIAIHGRAGRAKVEGQYGIKSVIERYLAVYDRVLQQHPQTQR